MKTTKLFGCLAAAGLIFVTAPAYADGVGVPTRAIKAKERTSLKTEIAKQKLKNPDIFKKVAEAPKLAVEHDERKRGRVASIVMPLAGLGKEALMPMLEMLAFDGPVRGKMSDGAWLTLRTGLIEAVGLVRDPRANPVLNAILDRETDYEMVRAAAEALGRIGDDQSAKKLAKLALTPGPKQLAVVSAIGECRRTVAATALASLVGTKDPAQAHALVKSLGAVGNAWAWQTAEIAKSGEGDTVRAIAARALVNAFVTYDGHTRTKAGTQILIVNDPSTPGLIAAAKQGKSPDVVAALGELETRFANNPAK